MKNHLKAIKSDGQLAIGTMRKISAVDDNYQILHEGDFILIPISEGMEGEVEGLGEVVGIEVSPRQKKPMPEGIKGSYDVIGNIVIMKRSNVRDPAELAKNLLARPGINSVYLDLGVQGANRTRKLSHLAGNKETTTLYRENGIELMVDVENAYFSPRLATERMRVSDSVKDGEFIIDLFAGIGPFSVLIARNHQCSITAIDHNPRAVELLRENMRINRLSGTITPIEGDAEAEVKKLKEADRIIMNLPHGAFNFIGAALNSLRTGGIVNFYEVSTVEGITERMQSLREMGLSLKSKREVHGYSKNEYMYSLELEKD